METITKELFEELKPKLDYIKEHWNDNFLYIDVYDNIMKVNKCSFSCDYHKDRGNYKYYVHVNVPYIKDHNFLIEDFELNEYGFYREYGDDGHYGEQYFINLKSNNEFAYDLVYKNIEFHCNEVNKLELVLNLMSD